MGDNYVSTSDKDINVPFSDDEAVKDDELITDDEPSLKLTNPEEAKRRADRRKERAQQRERERKQQEEELKTLREASQKTERELAELRGYVAASANQPKQREQGADPYQEKLDAIESERANAYAAAQAEIKAGTMDEKRSKHYEQLGRDLEERRVNTLVERQLTRAQATAAARRPQEEAQALYRAKYPDIYQNQKAYAYASAEWQKRTQALGQQPTDELLDEVMNEARTHFKLGPKPQATAAERARMSGIPSSGGSGGDGKSGGGITMTPEFRKMAEAKYSDLPQKQAWQKWADNEGKALRAAKVI